MENVNILEISRGRGIFENNRENKRRINRGRIMELREKVDLLENIWLIELKVVEIFWKGVMR